MNILKNRPLFVILSVMIIGFVLFSFLTIEVKIALFIFVLLLALLLIFFKTINNRIFLLILAMSMLLSFGASELYFDYIYSPTKRIQNEATIEGIITDIDYRAVYGGSFDIKVDVANSKRIIPLKIKLEFENIDTHTLDVGDRISADVTVSDYRGNSQNTAYDYSNGVCGSAISTINYILISKDNYTLDIKLQQYRETLCNYLSEICGENPGALLSAVLIGERGKLPHSLTLDFQRIGITHLLALSGLHLSILSFALYSFLSLFKLNKKAKYVINIIFVVLYIALTGFSPSILRAGILLIITSLLFIFGFDHDNLTALTVCVFFIIICKPYYVFNLSLWLSTFATFALFLIPKKQNQSKRKLLSRLLKIPFSVLTGFLILGMTNVFSFFRFSAISILSPLTTPIFGILIELYIFIGLFGIVFGSLIPLQSVLQYLYQVIEDLSYEISKTKGVFISTNSLLAKIFVIFFFVSLLAFLIFKVNRKKLCAVILSIIFVFSYSYPILLNFATITNPSANYSQDETNEYLTITQNKTATLYDMSKGSKSLVNNKVQSLLDNQITSIDTLVFTHYSSNLSTTIKTYVTSIKTFEIYLPSPQNEDEEKIFEEVQKVLLENRVNITAYKAQDELNVNGMIFTPLYLPQKDDGAKVIYTLKSNDIRITYFGKGAITNQNYDLSVMLIDLSNVVIFGCRGREPDKLYTLSLESTNLSKLVLTTESFSFLTEDLENYINKGGKVLFSPSECDLFN